MQAVITLIVILAVGYLSAHYLIGKLQSRFFFTSGIEYLFVGILVGPLGMEIMTPDVLNQLSPIMSMAIGAVGLFYGLQFRLRDMSTVDSEGYRVAFTEVVLTFVLITGSFSALFWYFYSTHVPSDTRSLMVFSSALALGATAAVSAPTAISVVQTRYGARGPLSRMLKFVAAFDELLGIILFGMIFCLLHIGQTSGIRTLTRVEWVAVNIGFGVLLGLLFFLFLGKEQSKKKLMVALLGLIIFSSGVSYYLNLSPLLMNLILGFMLANTSRIREQLLEVLQSVEKPVYVLLLVFAGAAWNWKGGYPWYAYVGLAGVYIWLRYLGKIVGGFVAYKTSEDPEKLARRIGFGLLSQGGVTLAMIVNYQQVYQSDLTGLVMTCVLASVVFYEFFSPNLTRNVLVDFGEVRISAEEGEVTA